jgi:hypothetical protein
MALILVTSLVAVPATTWAQAGTPSALAGVVKDTSGYVLPGVTVEAESPALIEKVRTTITDGQGQWKIPELPTGTYNVTFKLEGFSSLRRQGIELGAAFTATVNAELPLGSLSETITVSGQAPLVDVQNAVQQKTISRKLLDALPSNRSLLGFAALTPQVILPPDAQDVGGSKGELSVRMAVHGAKQTDQKLLFEGMRMNHMLSDGTSRSFYVNTASAQEIVISLGAGIGLAEQSVGGVIMNVVAKDGGNTFSEYLYVSGTGEQLQADNRTPELTAQGLTSANKNSSNYDVNGTFGGPMSKDRLWFFTAHRFWGNTTKVANLFHDTDLTDWAYTPDLGSPATAKEVNESHNLHLTWQATKQQKFSIFYDWQHNRDSKDLVTNPGTLAWEAVPYQHRQPSALSLIKWNYVATNHLYFEAAFSVLQQVVVTPYPEGVDRQAISVLEQSTGFRYRAPTGYQGPRSGNHADQRASMSYVTGSHNFKVGMFAMEGRNRVSTFNGTDAQVSYRFNNGIPNQITEYSSPIFSNQWLKPELGIYAQDQWKIRRLSLGLGLRFEHYGSYVAENTEPANRFLPARHFDKVECVPCWNDLDPRLGVAYDLFNDGRTALKGSFGRYTASRTVTIAAANDPSQGSTVSSVTRTWTDTNKNFIPDCDLANPQANNGGDQCGQMSNLAFGTTRITTTYDPDYLKGFKLNTYNWQMSASVEHQLTNRLVVSGGYFRTWYGNFTVTDNKAVTPADFDPYCITAPVNPRLPGGGGNQICGLYDVNPLKSGQVQNVVTLADHYGKQTEVYNGVDFNFNMNLPRGGTVGGGVNVGNSISNTAQSQTLNGTTSATDRCFVVDSPGELYQCKIEPPYRAQFKIAGVYPLPVWGIQLSANFQSIPGAAKAATYNATSEEISKTLGRPLSGNATSVPIALIAFNSEFEGRINQLDSRISKRFKVGKGHFEAIVDVYNTLNASPILRSNGIYGPAWLQPQEILAGRLIKFGGQLEF